MKTILLLIVLFSVSVFVDAQVQNTVQPNSVVLTEMLDSTALEIQKELNNVPHTIVVTGHPDSLWIQAVVAGRNSAGEYDLKIVPIDISVRYMPAESADSVERICTVSLQAEAQSIPQKRLVIMPRVQKKIIARKQIEWLNDKQHTATNPIEPPKPRLFWEDILEPVVFVAAAIVTVGLFFTVRSQ